MPLYTNKTGLPEAVVRAVTNDPYNKGDADFTVTELLRPPRQRALMLRHAEEIEEDIADRLWSLYGQMGHLLLERAGVPNDITEKRYKARFEWPAAKLAVTVSGQVDSLSLQDRVLTDWKFTTSYKFMAGKKKPEDYIWQLNMQRRLLELQPEPIAVERLQIGGMLRDWQIRKAEEDARYPQTPICIMPIPKLKAELVDGYIFGRVAAHRDAEEQLPECTPEEAWGRRRCKNYCSVAKFCDQYQKTKGVQHGRD